MSTRVLYCHCTNSRVLPAETREAALRALCDSGQPFDAVADLCELSARRDPLLKCIAAAGRVVVAACHPRTVRWLFVAAGTPLPEETTRLLNLRTGNPETVCDGLRGALDREPALPPRDFETLRDQLESAATTPDGWIPWAPVIDYDRCTGCMQCLGFCLFGVYGVDADSRIEVCNPQQCKTSCPACARVCPEAAILFPKHAADAINGGQAAGDGAAREAMKVDLSALLGGDLYSRLRERNSRFSKDRDPAQALEERRKYLAALAQAGEIPPEVFNALPTPEEIARRAAEAKANAQAALETKNKKP
ncbi:MAG: ferredoxin family protein [Verrucomicrobiae bacterium]